MVVRPKSAQYRQTVLFENRVHVSFGLQLLLRWTSISRGDRAERLWWSPAMRATILNISFYVNFNTIDSVRLHRPLQVMKDLVSVKIFLELG